MYSIKTSVLSFLFLSAFGLAAPAPLARSPTPRGSVEPYRLYRRQGAPTPVAQTVVNSFDPSTHFAAVTYCALSTTKTWTCGEHCDANPGFQPSLVGGDGGDTPQFYVGFDPTLNTVVVAHQGTDPSKIESLLVDAAFVPDTLDPTLFPGIPSSVKAHNGFRDAHARSAQQILQAVQNELSTRGTNNVMVVGHSLGGALALLEGVSLGLRLPATTQLKVITYGMPRVGNQQFADFVDAHVKLTRITNRKDLVPILPGRFLGFRHPSGEEHFPSSKSGVLVACQGQDNTNGLCSVGDAKNIFFGNIDDHFGPYNGIEMRC